MDEPGSLDWDGTFTRNALLITPVSATTATKVSLWKGEHTSIQ